MRIVAARDRIGYLFEQMFSPIALSKGDRYVIPCIFCEAE
jgi:hypothetical protein